VTGAAEFPVSWYDGRSALRHEGLLCWQAGERLVLRHPQAEGIDFGADELTFREERPGERVYSLQGTPGFRLMLSGEAPRAIEALLPAPSRYGGWIDRFGLARAAIGFAAISAALAAIVLTAPTWLGPMIPTSWERRMGEAMIGDFGNRICHTRAGDAALAKLARKLDPGGEPIRVGVANLRVVNAAALPGGQILVFDGLVQNAQSADELAGVLAHEIGHVRERHVMSAMLRQFGISVLAAGVNSGVGQSAFGIAALVYTREAESEADAFARARMERARISPAGTVQFFERLRTDAGGGDHGKRGWEEWTTWIQSHPSPDDRAEAFRKAIRKDRRYEPALTAREFAAIRSMCRDDKNVDDFSIF
jgi:Zn-dependent protease with chaperone function